MKYRIDIRDNTIHSLEVGAENLKVSFKRGAPCLNVLPSSRFQFPSFLMLLFLVLNTFTGHCQELPIFQIDSIKVHKDFTGEYAAYWIDEEGNADINFILQNEKTIPFKIIGDRLPNTKNVYWCKWQVQNVMKDPVVVKDWILYTGKSDYLEVYFVNTNGEVIEYQQSGDLVPMSLKKLSKKHFVERIPFSLPHSEVTTMYFRLQRICGFPPKLNLQLHQQDFYKRSNYLEKAPERWLFFGMLFTLAFLAIGFFAIGRDKAFLYYGLFLFALSAYMIDAFFNVYGNFGFFREHPTLIMYWIYGLVTLMNVAHVMFIREYIGSKVNFPKWDRIAYFVVILNVLMGLVAWGIYGFTNDEFLTDKIIIPGIIGTYFFLFTIIIPILWYRQWSVENLLIFISVSLFTFAILINTISIFNGTNLRIVETQWILTLVILIFSIGLAFGLVYRFHRHNKEQQEVQRLQDLGELKAQFYQNITHEFRTPLTVISGVTEQLRKETTVSRSPQMSKKVEMIRRNGNNLLQLVNRLLDMARLETGKMELKSGNGDIIIYLRYLVESIGSYADKKVVNLQLLTNLESLEMDFDKEKIRQVLYNLMSNSIKFSNENGKVNIIAEKASYKNLPALLVKVKDDGLGIAKSDLPRIFDRFYQGERTETAQGQGSGIGLALTKELIELMGGKITIESNLDKGTLVQFYLPIKNEARPFELEEIGLGQARETVVSENEEQEETQQSINTSFLPETEQQAQILLVEDNWDVLEFIKSILQKNYQIEVARNGAQGIELATEKIPDLIISDIMMPKKDGYELTAHLKKDERTSHIPIVLLTAKSTQQSKLEGLEHGADAYLTKPFEQKELELRVRNLLAHRQKLQEKWARAQSDLDLVDDGLNDKDRKFLEDLTAFIEKNIADEDLDVARMQRAMHLSRPQLHRKLKALTGLSAAKFRKKIRLQKAYVMLKEKKGTVAEVAYDVGYKHPSHFSSDFKEAFGLSPGKVSD